MPLPSDEEFHTSAMVAAVRDMARQLEQFHRHADEERDKLRGELVGLAESMRKDVHKAIAALQIDAMQHKDTHTADGVQRSNRQLIQDLWLGALTVLGVVNLALAIYLAAQVAQR